MTSLRSRSSVLDPCSAAVVVTCRRGSYSVYRRRGCTIEGDGVGRSFFNDTRGLVVNTETTAALRRTERKAVWDYCVKPVTGIMW